MLKRTIRWIMPIVMLLVIATFLLLSHASATFAAGATIHAEKNTQTVTATSTPASSGLGGIMIPNLMGGH